VSSAILTPCVPPLQQHHGSQQQQQQQPSGRGGSPGARSSPGTLAETHVDQVEPDLPLDIGMSRPRSLTPDELKHKKKAGGLLSKGKNILKKFTR